MFEDSLERKVGELCDWRYIGVILKRTSKLCKVFGFCHVGRKWGTFGDWKVELMSSVFGFCFVLFCFFLRCMACGILVPPPGIEPRALGSGSVES